MRFLFILVACALLAGGTLPAQARDASVVRAEMLMSQKARLHKMSKSVCYLIAGADRALLSKAALTAAEGFDEALMALQEGGGAAGAAGRNARGNAGRNAGHVIEGGGHK